MLYPNEFNLNVIYRRRIGDSNFRVRVWTSSPSQEPYVESYPDDGVLQADEIDEAAKFTKEAVDSFKQITKVVAK